MSDKRIFDKYVSQSGYANFFFLLKFKLIYIPLHTVESKKCSYNRMNDLGSYKRLTYEQTFIVI